MFKDSKRFRRSDQKRSFGGITLAPMIDVVFLLLIFFMVSTTFVTRPGLQVVLPRSGGEVKVPSDRWVISITQEAEVYLNEKPVQLSTLSSRLNQDPLPVLLRADENVPHGLVVSVLDRVRSAGIEDLNLSTRPIDQP